jgi:hypothetical protein
MSDEQTYHCSVCGQETSKEDYEDYDRMCWECWEVWFFCGEVSTVNDVESKNYKPNEDVLKRLQEFAIRNGRLPEIGEPGIEDVVNIAKKEFGSLENALRIAGLLPESRIGRRETLKGVVMRLLDWNPMTLGQIREEVRKVPGFANTSAAVIATAVCTSQHIVSIGPRRQKVYFLEGQGERALAKEKNSSTRAPEDVLRIRNIDFDSSANRKRATQDPAVVIQSIEPFANDDNTRTVWYCQKMKRDVKVTGNPVGKFGSGLIRVVGCEVTECSSLNTSDCLIGTLRPKERYLQ